MTITRAAIKRDHVRDSVESFMDLTEIDSFRRFEVSFTIGRLTDTSLASAARMCESYDERDRRSVGTQITALDMAGASETEAAITRMIFAYVAAAPAFTLLETYSTTIMWHVIGAMDRMGLSLLPPDKMSTDELAAIRGMLIQSHVEGQCLVTTSFDDHSFIGSRLPGIAKILPELTARFSVDRGLVETILGADDVSTALRNGAL